MVRCELAVLDNFMRSDAIVPLPFPAISTVLNNPKRSQAPLKASRAPLPAAISSELPRVRRKDFDAYVNAISPAWEQFTRHAPQRTTSNPSLHASVRGKTREIPPLSSVPSIFFDPSFDLRHPHTFASVTEQDAASTSGALSSRRNLNPEDISLNQILQEKLSHYMDVVEQHLTREVQSRSTSFFAALSNLQDLQTEGADCLDRISSLRKRLQEVDSTIARKGLQTIKLQKRLSNIETVEQATTALKEVSDTVSLSDRLITEASWEEALAILAVLEEVGFPPAKTVENGDVTNGSNGSNALSSPGGGYQAKLLPSGPPTHVSNPTSPVLFVHPTHPNGISDVSESQPLLYSLSSLTALSSLPDQIRSSRSRISSSLRASIIDMMKSDLIDRFDKGIPRTDLAHRNSKLQQRLTPLWQGILRTDGVVDTLHSYHDTVLSSVRSCIRKVSVPLLNGISFCGHADEHHLFTDRAYRNTLI